MQHTHKQGGSEAAWLAAAYDLLTENGVEAVKVMPLAKKLGLSRTGFYWHFKDRDQLLEAMVRRWEQKNTGNLVARAEAYADTIAEAMFNVFDCWLDDALFDARLDLAIRNWARNDAALQQRLDQADSRRQNALTAMFERFEFGREQAHARAMTVMYTQIGYISMRVTEGTKERIDRMPDYIEVYTGQRPTQAEIERFRSRHPA
ncbi:transcriptional regulator, TetR family [Shimia gijangensis]|uniref:Transcriptional regulator, TetR family n=1 Tax=Shimia gijangensis TaxID=1470563 RepID=A0A1M6GI84_9RHOB|nr:TetR/AcrR family transcriptional regulator [Shimia gijangensis]SHJ09612.1 transcriptional regulator, TetR family [Shimia gijangensis]